MNVTFDDGECAASWPALSTRPWNGFPMPVVTADVVAEMVTYQQKMFELTDGETELWTLNGHTLTLTDADTCRTLIQPDTEGNYDLYPSGYCFRDADNDIDRWRELLAGEACEAISLSMLLHPEDQRQPCTLERGHENSHQHTAHGQLHYQWGPGLSYRLERADTDEGWTNSLPREWERAWAEGTIDRYQGNPVTLFPADDGVIVARFWTNRPVTDVLPWDRGRTDDATHNALHGVTNEVLHHRITCPPIPRTANAQLDLIAIRADEPVQQRAATQRRLQRLPEPPRPHPNAHPAARHNRGRGPAR